MRRLAIVLALVTCCLIAGGAPAASAEDLTVALSIPSWAGTS
jgi:hypothetical protein